MKKKKHKTMLTIGFTEFPSWISKVISDSGLKLTADASLKARMETFSEQISVCFTGAVVYERWLNNVVDSIVLEAERRTDGWEEYVRNRFLMLPKRKHTDEQLLTLVRERIERLKRKHTGLKKDGVTTPSFLKIK